MEIEVKKGSRVYFCEAHFLSFLLSLLLCWLCLHVWCGWGERKVKYLTLIQMTLVQTCFVCVLAISK